MSNSKPTYEELIIENEKLKKQLSENTDATEHKQTEEEIKNQINKWQVTFNAMSDSVSIIDLDGTISQYNAATLSLFNVNEEEIKGKKCFELVHGTAEFFNDCPLVRMKDSHQPESMIFKEKDNWLEVNVDPIFNSKNELIGAVHVVSDITERKKVEEKLKESEKEFYSLYSNSPFGIVICSLIRDNEGNVIDFIHKEGNPAVEEQTGFKLKDLVGKKASEIVDDKVLADLVKMYGNVVSTGQTINYKQYFAVYDRTLDVRVYPLDADKFIMNFIDISARIEAEKNLLLSEEKFRSIYEQSPIAIEIFDVDGNLIELNQRTLDMFGVDDKKHVLGFNLWEDPNLSIEEVEALKSGKPISITTDFDFEIVKSNKLYPTSRSGVMHIDMYAIPLLGKNEFAGYLVHIMEVTDRKNAEVALRKQKNMFELVINSVPSRIFWKDLNSVYLGCNTAFLEAVKKNKIEDVIGKNDFDLIWGKEAEKYINDDRQVIKKGVSKLGYEESYVLPDGKNIWWQSSKMPLKDDTGKIIGVLAASEDVTERKQTEKALKESEEKLNLIINTSPIGICTVDMFGNFITTNRAYERILGYTKEELMGLSFFDVTHQDDRPKNKRLFQDMFTLDTKGFFMEKRYNRKGGEVIKVSVHAIGISDVEGNIIYGTAFVDDITERKKAEIALKQSEEMHRLLTQNSVDVIWKVDLKMNFIYVSPNIYELTGFTQEEWIGKKLSAYCSGKEFFNIARKALKVVKNYKTLEQFSVEANIFNKDKEEIPVEFIGRAVLNDKGSPVALQGSTRNIMERKLAKDEVKNYQEHLEELVMERTKNLEEKNKELERFNNLFVDREFRIKELREKIIKLENGL